MIGASRRIAYATGGRVKMLVPVVVVMVTGAMRVQMTHCA